jgi:hypothetical protein
VRERLGLFSLLTIPDLGTAEGSSAGCGVARARRTGATEANSRVREDRGLFTSQGLGAANLKMPSFASANLDCNSSPSLLVISFAPGKASFCRWLSLESFIVLTILSDYPSKLLT